MLDVPFLFFVEGPAQHTCATSNAPTSMHTTNDHGPPGLKLCCAETHIGCTDHPSPHKQLGACVHATLLKLVALFVCKQGLQMCHFQQPRRCQENAPQWPPGSVCVTHGTPLGCPCLGFHHGSISEMPYFASTPKHSELIKGRDDKARERSVPAGGAYRCSIHRRRQTNAKRDIAYVP